MGEIIFPNYEQVSTWRQTQSAPAFRYPPFKVVAKLRGLPSLFEEPRQEAAPAQTTDVTEATRLFLAEHRIADETLEMEDDALHQELLGIALREVSLGDEASKEEREWIAAEYDVFRARNDIEDASFGLMQAHYQDLAREHFAIDELGPSGKYC